MLIGEYIKQQAGEDARLCEELQEALIKDLCALNPVDFMTFMEKSELPIEDETKEWIDQTIKRIKEKKNG